MEVVQQALNPKHDRLIPDLVVRSPGWPCSSVSSSGAPIWSHWFRRLAVFAGHGVQQVAGGVEGK
jgi:hypothetical protein